MQDQHRIWQRMLSGRRLNLAEPSPLDIEIEDIAHGLSRTNRWSGQTAGKHGLSVAQHSVLVAQQLRHHKNNASHQLQLAALLHDAAEYVIGDMISPFKKFIGGDYVQIEQGLQSAIHQRFGLALTLPKSWHHAIKRADRNIAWLEATELAGFTALEAHKFIAKKPNSLFQNSLEATSPETAKQDFLQCFRKLTDDMATA